MKKPNGQTLAVFIAIIGLLIVTAYCAISLRRDEPRPVQPLLEQGSGGFGRTPCAQCVNPNCASASCNMECEYGSDWCTTHVMGGGGGSYARGTDDYADFVNFRVMKNCKSMEKAGVPLGSTVTHVNGVYISNQDEFAAAVLDLRGKSLRLIVQDGSAVEVTLK